MYVYKTLCNAGFEKYKFTHEFILLFIYFNYYYYYFI